MKRLVYIAAGIIAVALLSCSKQEVGITPFIFQNTTIAEFNAQAADDNYYYYLSGTIGEIVDVVDSHFFLEDETGSTLVWGLWKNIHGKRIRNMGDYSSGDRITIAALKGKFADRPYAKEAYIVGEGSERMWVTPANAVVSCGGGDMELNVFTCAYFTLAASESWIKIRETDGNAVHVTIDANESIFPRFGYINVRSDDVTVRVKVTQEEFVPELSTVSRALLSDYARVEGTVVALAQDGYLLADMTGTVFIGTDKFNGIYPGATLSVTGSLETADYMTRLSPELTKAIQIEPVSSPMPRELSPDEIDSIISAASAKDGNSAGSLEYEFVRVRGTLVFLDGRTRLVSGSRTINVEPYKPGNELNFDDLNGHTLEMDGYLISLTGGMLKIVVTGYEDIPVESSISIDGDYSDWEKFEDLAPGNDMGASHNLKPVVKLHYENGYVYGYIRVDKSGENGGYPKNDQYQYLMHIAGNFFVWIDNDDVAEGQGGGWLFDPQRYDNIICYRITDTPEGYNGWVTTAPRKNSCYAESAVGNYHFDGTESLEVGYMATTADGDILEGEFSFLAAKAGLFGREKAVIGLELGWDNWFNSGSASLGKKGYEIQLVD